MSFSIELKLKLPKDLKKLGDEITKELEKNSSKEKVEDVESKTEKKEVPNFETQVFNTNKTMNSEEIFSDDKYYLFNIWASWCVPCRDEHYFLMSLREQKKLEIIGLNYKDNINNAKNFLDELNNPYKTIFSDLNGTIAIEWGAYGVPETFLIYDRKIIKKIIGPLNQSLTSEIISLIK